jgi:hypothetical protein
VEPANGPGRAGSTQKVTLTSVRHVSALVGAHRAGVVRTEVSRLRQSLEDLPRLPLTGDALEDLARHLGVPAAVGVVALDDPGVDRRGHHQAMVPRRTTATVPRRRDHADRNRTRPRLRPDPTVRAP